MQIFFSYCSLIIRYRICFSSLMAKIKILFSFFLPIFCLAQNNVSPVKAPLGNNYKGLQLPEKAIEVQATIYNGDTIPYVILPSLEFYVPRFFKNKKDAEKWNRLKFNVRKVYPYAILAAARLKEYEKVMSKISNENEKKKYMKLAEKKLKDEFGNELKNLTMTQGRILIKLIDRETGKTAFKIVKEMRGTFSAFMWQSLAVLFSSNLKDQYDPNSEDKAIEQAIKLIEDLQ